MREFQASRLISALRIWGILALVGGSLSFFIAPFWSEGILNLGYGISGGLFFLFLSKVLEGLEALVRSGTVGERSGAATTPSAKHEAQTKSTLGRW